jgi:hypothetical protein
LTFIAKRTAAISKETIANAVIALQNIEVYADIGNRTSDNDTVLWKDSEPYDSMGLVWGDIWPYIADDSKQAMRIFNELRSNGYVVVVEYTEDETPVAYALSREGCEFTV